MRIPHFIRAAASAAAMSACSASTPTDSSHGGGAPPPPPPPPLSYTIARVSGDTQQATLGTALPAALVVAVTDSRGNPASGVTVNWLAAAGNGALSAASATTDANGHASVRWTLDNTYLGVSLLADITNGGSVQFTAVGNGSGDLGGRTFFPSGSPWRSDISTSPVDPNSDSLIATCGATSHLHPDFGTTYAGAPNGIPYVVVHGSQPTIPVSFDYADESDPGPYPIPSYAPIEGGSGGDGDRHVLVVDADRWKLYEMFDAHPVSGGTSWTGGSGAIFDLKTGALRPAGWTSADAAGLPILPGLVRYDEVVLHHLIAHALRFTCSSTRRAYVPPARHWASSRTSANLPPMGMRVRLKAGVDISGYSANLQVILKALKKYGMFVADNGSNMFLSGAPDPRWSDDELHGLGAIKGSDFEVVKMEGVVVGP